MNPAAEVNDDCRKLNEPRQYRKPFHQAHLKVQQIANNSNMTACNDMSLKDEIDMGGFRCFSLGTKMVYPNVAWRLPL